MGSKWETLAQGEGKNWKVFFSSLMSYLPLFNEGIEEQNWEENSSFKVLMDKSKEKESRFSFFKKKENFIFNTSILNVECC